MEQDNAQTAAINAVSDEQAEEAAFEAGFNATDIEPVVQKEEPTEKAEETPEPKADEPKPPEKRLLNEDDLTAIENKMKGDFGKNFDRVFGKIGEISQKLAELQNMRAQATSLSPKARERLRDEFPELETLLFDDDSKEESTPKGNTPERVDQLPPQSEQTIENKLSAEQLVERRLLKRDHPDWEQVVYSPDFVRWVDTLPAAEKEQLRSSWDADYVSQKLTEFKAAKTSANEESESKQAEKEKNKKDRLNAAVIPRRTATDINAEADDEEAAMLKSFRSMR